MLSAVSRGRALGRWLAPLLLVGALAVPVASVPSAGSAPASLTGTVEGGGAPLGLATVTAFQAGSAASAPVELGSTTTDAGGAFALAYDQPAGQVIYLVAEPAGGPSAVRLVSVLGADPVFADVVINEATTVASGYALAQFTAGDAIGGPSPGLENAAGMALNLVDPGSGQASAVLTSSPNGSQTETLGSFGSLANLLASCVASAPACAGLLADTTPPGGPAPVNTFQAAGSLARHPNGAGGSATADLYTQSTTGPVPFTPVRPAAPDAWTLAVRFDGGGDILDGPGNFAIDHEGSLWVPNNYDYDADPLATVCGSKELLRFTPTGELYPGSPYTGGGVNGIGFGVDIDPYGDVWLANFGFASPAPGCPAADQPPHDSVSQFRGDGTPVSPDTGYTQTGMSWPQGITTTAAGDVWTATCENNLVVRYPEGDPTRAQVFDSTGIDQGMDVVDNGERIFVSGTLSDTVAVLDHEGQAVPGSPVSGGGLQNPMGMAAGGTGHVWVSNSGLIDLPCGQKPTIQPNPPSITLLGPDGSVQSPANGFTGGGITIPWGITVDGDDNVWVANFGQQRLSQFCGVTTAACPPGATTGDALSPDGTGYSFDGLVRNTGVIVDTAGNVWLANNWVEAPEPQRNPGGHEIVAYVGMAAPVQPPAPVDRPAIPVDPVGPIAGRPSFTG
jgi:sugar lactone lactonase YvrE